MRITPRGESVHHVVRRIDGSMATTTRILRRFGVPSGTNKELNGLKRAVGDLVAQLEMVERRDKR